MDDLEKAIIFVHEPGAADPGLRTQAMAFCEQAKADPFTLLRLCLDRLHRSSLVPVQFWCLQALHNAILLCYPSLPSTDLPLPSFTTSLPRPSPLSSASSTPHSGLPSSSTSSPASSPPTPSQWTCSLISSPPSTMTSSARTTPAPPTRPPPPASRMPCASNAFPRSPSTGSRRCPSTAPSTPLSPLPSSTP